MVIDEYFLGQVLGGVSFALALIAYYQKSDVKLKALLTIVFLVHGAHFYFLGALVPAVLCGISAIRTLVSIVSSSFKLTLFFIAIIFVAGIFNYQTPIDLLVVLANIIGVYALFRLEGIKLRLGIVLGASLWLIHNALLGSIGGTLMEIFVISTNMLTMYRIDHGAKQADRSMR